MIYIAFYLTVLFIVIGLFLVPSHRKQKDQARLGAYLGEGSITQFSGSSLQKEDQILENKRPSLFQSLWKRTTSRLKKKPQSNGKLDRLEDKLLQAGSPLNMTAVDFRLMKVLSIVAGLVFFGGLSFAAGAPIEKMIVAVFIGLIFGWIVPPVWLNSKIQKRAKSALKELPDFVDLLTVSLEAGLGFDSALSKVIEKQSGVLADEFHLCLDEIRLGKTRREGLLGIKSRLKVDEIGMLLSNVIRAEKLGVGMVQVLRVQAVEVRDKRKQRAEEQAMKAPIKMLFPLVIFIFPSLFLIILGPAVIQIIQAFKQ